MTDRFQAVAEAAAFRSFANGYMREIDPGIAVSHAGSDGTGVACVEWMLRAQRVTLRAEIRSPSLCGAYRFGEAWQRHPHEPRWRPAAPMAAVQLLLSESFARAGGSALPGARERELALLARILDSYRETLRHLVLAAGSAGEGDDFIDAERSLVFGHWLHPTPKSRGGMTLWQARRYGSEEGGTFPLAVFAAHEAHVRQRSAGAPPAALLALDLLGPEAADLPLHSGEVALPMHPLQAEALLMEPHVERMLSAGTLRFLGPCGRPFTATSSLRTVYAPDCDWMAKFSLPVTLTNSLRVNRMAELEAGVAMVRLARQLDLGRTLPRFRIVADPAYLTLALPDRRESGFETILRENPFRSGGERGIAAVAALTAEPLPGRPSRLAALVAGLVARTGGRPGAVAAEWFERYLDCMLEPVVALYDRHGIGLEAHQQNALLDVSSGWPTCGYYRDNQGFYLLQEARLALEALVPETGAIPSLYFPEAEVRRRLCYYLVVNQVFSVVSRLGHDGLAGEEALVQRLAARLERIARETGGPGRAFARSILEGATLCTKANLRIRLLGRDELTGEGDAANYMSYPNPLLRLREHARDALAS